MNDLPQLEALRVIKDRVQSRYLSSWSGPENDPTSLTWSPNFKDAHGLTIKQSHVLRAGIISMRKDQGGIPETSVTVMDYAEAEKASRVSGDVVLGKVVLNHPLQGFYVKHVLEDSTWTITWSSSIVQAALLERSAAEHIRESSGIPALELIDARDLAFRGAKEGGKRPGALLRPEPAARLPAPKLRYAVAIGPTIESLIDHVNAHLAEGAQLVGGMISDTNGYMQAFVIRDEAQS